jgi:anti-sigma factor RsiW
MTCEEFHVAVGDYVDGRLTREARRPLEEHIAGCAACATLASDLARVRQLASSLERLSPPAAAWPRIAREARLPGGEGSRESGRTMWRVWMPLAAAACVLMAVALTYVLRQPASSGPDTHAAARTAAGAGARTDQPELQSIATELELAEQHYEKAIAGLEQLASDRRVLDPRVAAVLQKNFQVIDQSIAESRAAVKAQPTSDQAQQSLFEAFRTKIVLLQDTIALINEMRKGNQAGAARIAEGISKS